MRRRPLFPLLGLALLGCADKTLVRTGPASVGMPAPPPGAHAVAGTELAMTWRGFSWIDGRRLLTLQAPKGTRRTDGSLDSGGNRAYYAVDTHTGAREAFAPFRDAIREIRRPGGGTVEQPDDVKFAGDWILYARPGDGKAYDARSMKDGGRRSWPVPEDVSFHAHWFPHGRRWLLTRNDYALIYSLADDRPQTVQIEGGVGRDVLNAAYVLGFVGPDSFLIKGGTPDGVHFYRVDLREGRALATRIPHVERDDSLGFNDVVLSPDGTMLAYRNEKQILKVSDLVGNRSYAIAPQVEPDTILWTPDSRRILFGDRNCIWITDAPAALVASPKAKATPRSIVATSDDPRPSRSSREGGR